MKIEKVNDNQIRCILTAEELASRGLRLSELAYGTEKARRLFRDMMEQAEREFGFTAEDMPIMIEAIPLSQNSIAVVVTKVDNPEELDTRYSSFAPSVQRDMPSGTDEGHEAPSPFEQLLDHMKQALESGGGKKPAGPLPSADPRGEERPSDAEAPGYLFTHRLFSFTSMNDLLRAARAAAAAFDQPSTLYSMDGGAPYYLFLELTDADTASRMKDALARLSEFGRLEEVSAARIRYLEEHAVCMARGDALQQLASI